MLTAIKGSALSLSVASSVLICIKNDDPINKTQKRVAKTSNDVNLARVLRGNKK